MHIFFKANAAYARQEELISLPLFFIVYNQQKTTSELLFPILYDLYFSHCLINASSSAVSSWYFKIISQIYEIREL